ncbi:unnamed protein product [Schistosoma margrebowiei]|uniref:Uncharacterized protein n=1 Tax=Schistosoma margrebowiei TaxID=48269 RepID=A0AA85AJ17_9TREM|nr:unnamed protein product [Schistosoma margrebowiei]
MRHSFATGQFILLYLIIVLIYKFFDCHEICTNPELKIYDKEIFKSHAYNFSHHYYYSRTILSDQSPPIVSGKFEILNDTKEINATFPFTFYGSQVTNFRILTTGELLAVRTSYYLDGDGDENS